jgi:uncharacterized protein with PIN domain
MTYLDAYAVVALVADEPAADEVEEILRAGGVRVVVANLAESIDISHRVNGLPLGEVRGALAPLLDAEVIEPVASMVTEAWLAAELRAKHYDKRTAALSLADCLLLAHALEAQEAIATANSSLADAARSEGVDVVALPDSAGARPE